MRPTIVTSAFTVVLLLLAIFIGGAGHGILLPIALLGAPFLAMNSAFSLIPLILFWLAVGYFTQRWSKYVFPLLMLLSYSSFTVYFILNFQDEFHDSYRDIRGLWDYFAVWLIAFAVLYLAEQFLLWRWWIKRPS